MKGIEMVKKWYLVIDIIKCFKYKTFGGDCCG
ncbi:hypothetical protein M2454_003062 [Aequitasia blattaphilus]